MCLIITIITAAVLTVVWFILRQNGKNVKSLFTTMLAFWAAALMWSVDGVASVIGGEPFFDRGPADPRGFFFGGAGHMNFRKFAH